MANGSTPASTASSRSSRAQNAWNVVTVSSSYGRAIAVSIRACRSSAAPVENVSTRISSGDVSFSTSHANRSTSTRVFPVPAPATISSGPPGCWTAASWAGVRGASGTHSGYVRKSPTSAAFERSMRTRLGVLTLALSLALAIPALAAPDQSGTLSATAPTFAWDGRPGTGFSEPLLTGSNPGCAAPAGYDCDDILLKLDSGGDLTVAIDAGDQQTIEEPTGEFGTVGAYPDLDVYIYKSDESGAASGEPISDGEECASGALNETCVAKNVKPGYYLAQIEYWLAVEHEYKGTATLSNFPAPAAPAPAPTPAATPDRRLRPLLRHPRPRPSPRPRAARPSPSRRRRSPRRPPASRRPRRSRTRASAPRRSSAARSSARRVPRYDRRQMTAADQMAATLAADWLGASRRAAEALGDILVQRPTTAERVRETGQRGEGGDRTLVIDSDAEEAVFRELRRLYEDGARFTAISEERGRVDFGSPDVTVVVDPIDGSMNAKRGLPHHSVSIAVADGPTMGDIVFGYVYDYGPDEEWTARRGEGAWLDGVLLDPTLGERRNPEDKLELLGIESADPRWVKAAAEDLAAVSHRLRALGTIAVTLCQVAAARLDGMVTIMNCRAVDAAAGQLIVREGGGLVAFTSYDDPLGAPLDVEPRSPVVAARSERGLADLARVPRV